jgi:hypothetical protein
MGGQGQQAPRTTTYLSKTPLVAGGVWLGQRLRWVPLSPSRSPKSSHWPRCVGLAIAAAGLMVVGAVTPSRADPSATCASAEADENSIIEAACCPSDVLSTYWPRRSPALDQTLCQLLVFPTANLASADEFSRSIVDGSLSSNSRHASAETMTLPSLWWNRDSLTNQLGGRRLVQSWISYQIKDSADEVVDVMINPQIWAVLTYNERFAVLNQFGTAARDFGYNLRFFQGNSRSSRLVGLYACDFARSPVSTSTAPLDVNTCSANLDIAQIGQIQRNLVAEIEQRQQTPDPLAQTVAADGDL